MKNKVLASISTLSLSLTLAFASACSTTTKAPEPPPAAPEAEANQTQGEAQARSQRVSDVDYTLTFQLSNEQEFYTGTSIIDFHLKDVRKDLKVDFQKGKILRLKINGKSVDPVYDKVSIFLPAEKLKVGKNKVEVSFQHPFSRDGQGLVRFQDPQDQRVYTYTNLQPFGASRVFPSFDQPDLKATYTITATVPSSWEVITSVREKSINENPDKSKTWVFPQSARFSTYIFSLHAGPYNKWEAFDNGKARIPLRLYARQSLIPYVKAEDWFTATRQGFEFFEGYFAYPYPYTKYDQIIVPEFPAGAMENVGAVTFTERFVSRGKASVDNRRRLTSTILHELAHMWFGNLVTMKWWNDLWLNESFATYMAALAMSENSPFKDEAWRHFNGMKSWAYWEDQLVTTHPIEASIPDTQSAFTNFDGITYGKGAAVLQQVSYFLGAETFQKGVQTYFKKHAGQNAELKDFMAALSGAAKDKDLNDWQRKWLQTAGVNTIDVDLSCQNGKIQELKLEQTAPAEHPVLRPHAFKVAFFDKTQGEFTANKVIKVQMDRPVVRVNEVTGSQCPLLVHPNYDDHGYFKVSLDERTIKTLKSEIQNVADPFMREMYWVALWEMVRDAQLGVTTFAEMALKNGLATEQDTEIVRQILRSLIGRHGEGVSAMYYYFHSPRLQGEAYKNLVTQVEALLWSRLKAAPAGSELQRIWFESYISVAESKKAQSHLVALLSEEIKPKGLYISQDQRWDMVLKLKELGHKEADDWVQAEKQKDQSSSGHKYIIAAQAATPERKVKEQWIEEFKKDQSSYSQAELRMALSYLFPKHQKALHKEYAEDFYEDLKDIHARKEARLVPSFLKVAPEACEPNELKKVDEFLKENASLTAPVLKQLRILRQEGERCLKITAKAEQ